MRVAGLQRRGACAAGPAAAGAARRAGSEALLPGAAADGPGTGRACSPGTGQEGLRGPSSRPSGRAAGAP